MPAHPAHETARRDVARSLLPNLAPLPSSRFKDSQSAPKDGDLPLKDIVVVHETRREALDGVLAEFCEQQVGSGRVSSSLHRDGRKLLSNPRPCHRRAKDRIRVPDPLSSNQTTGSSTPAPPLLFRQACRPRLTVQLPRKLERSRRRRHPCSCSRVCEGARRETRGRAVARGVRRRAGGRVLRVCVVLAEQTAELARASEAV